MRDVAREGACDDGNVRVWSVRVFCDSVGFGRCSDCSGDRPERDPPEKALIFPCPLIQEPGRPGGPELYAPGRRVCLLDVFLRAVVHHPHPHFPGLGHGKLGDAGLVKPGAQPPVGIEAQVVHPVAGMVWLHGITPIQYVTGGEETMQNKNPEPTGSGSDAEALPQIFAKELKKQKSASL